MLVRGVCSGTVGGASDVCVMNLWNFDLLGPLDGIVAFTQNLVQEKRAFEYLISRNVTSSEAASLHSIVSRIQPGDAGPRST